MRDSQKRRANQHADTPRPPRDSPWSRSPLRQDRSRGGQCYFVARAYSTQRGYERNHPFAGEIRSGYIDIFIVPE
ncbi:carbon-phosphorus lyase complex subunit PhnI, partial [Escherichia coli]|uniref:carbon-phosphorus lyase complex subunit PhnI n=1 Tax=Escherichia coli TaxID=562 RepID=UPI0020245E89